MTPKSHSRGRMSSRHLTMALLAGVVVALAGCSQMQSLKRKIGDSFGKHPPKTASQPVPAAARSAPAPVVDVTPVVPLKTIVAEQLQHGHYAEGKRQLHRYLEAHPDDRAARDLWHQLTVDPVRQLGSRSQIHVVQAGESYSSLAARYLGDADLFLLLARYNHASDPSLLQLGQRIRVPGGKAVAASGGRAETAGGTGSSGAGEASTAPKAPLSTEQKAEQLQQQSIALYDQGHRAQALNQLGQALDMDPQLKSSGEKADDLRKKLLASYHQRAIVLYRDQKLSQAIALWDKILAIDPDYEPAIIYRARARELQSRLNQL